MLLFLLLIGENKCWGVLIVKNNWFGLRKFWVLDELLCEDDYKFKLNNLRYLFNF